MGRSQETFNKKEKEKKRLKKKQAKQEKKVERKANATGGDMDSMIAYVDEFGNLTDTPPDPTKKKKIKAENIEIGVPKQIKEEFDPIRKGIVEFFNDQKGFGFIKDSETKEKYFVHVNNVIDEIKEGNMVIFELEQTPRGMSAIKVKKG